MNRSLRILLVQAREPRDPMLEHERECLSDCCGIAPDCLVPVNLVENNFEDLRLHQFDGVIVGGSGDFSLADGGFAWHEPCLRLLREVIDIEMPMFGCCFGLQAIVQALGGRVVTAPECSEVGAFPIELTERGRIDPLFGQMPEQFDAQLGHSDSVTDVPDQFIHLARSEQCEYQAVRVHNRPVVATQFHPELTRETSLDRFRNYICDYKPSELGFEEAMDHARTQHTPTPETSRLMEMFIRRVERGRTGSRSAE